MTAITETETILSITNITHRYGAKEVLSNVNASIVDNHRSSGEPSGQIVAFLGPSGCGKTTLLRIIAGLEKPTLGEVKVGKDQEFTHAGLVGLVDQRSTLFRNRTVLGNLHIAARQAIKDNPDGQAYKLLCEMGLAPYMNYYPSQLSGGQKQRVAIAQHILCSSHFLALDEPTAGLDPYSKRKVCQMLVDLSAKNINIILVTHDIRSALAIANKVWLMGHDGKQPGASILYQYDLESMGLDWHPGIKQSQALIDLEAEIISRFDSL